MLTRGGPIIWPLRGQVDVQALQANLSAYSPKSAYAPTAPPAKLFQVIFARQRPRSMAWRLAPDLPVNLPWNVVRSSMIDLPVSWPRVVHNLLPYPPTYFRITGTTLDATGAPLGSCVVDMFRTSDDVRLDSVTSDANGLYEFRTAGQPPNAYYLVAYKVGSPDVAGTTVNTLVGT